MKVRRNSEVAAHEQTLALHEQHVARWRESCESVAEYNRQENEFHEARVAEAEEHHARTLAFHEKVVAARERARKAHEERVRRYEEDQEKRRTLKGKALAALGLSPAEPPPDVFDGSVPEPPEKPEVGEPQLLEEPPEPEPPTGPPTYTAELVPDDVENDDGEPWVTVETPFGPARAHAGAYVLTNDETGAKHIEAAETFERAYTRA